MGGEWVSEVWNVAQSGVGLDLRREREIVIAADESGGLSMWSFSVCRTSDHDMRRHLIRMAITAGRHR